MPRTAFLDPKDGLQRSSERHLHEASMAWRQSLSERFTRCRRCRRIVCPLSRCLHRVSPVHLRAPLLPVAPQRVGQVCGQRSLSRFFMVERIIKKRGKIVQPLYFSRFPYTVLSAFSLYLPHQSELRIDKDQTPFNNLKSKKNDMIVHLIGTAHGGVPHLPSREGLQKQHNQHSN